MMLQLNSSWGRGFVLFKVSTPTETFKKSLKLAFNVRIYIKMQSGLNRLRSAIKNELLCYT